MAVAPLFLASTTALRSELRLTEAKTGGDFDTLLNRAILNARLRFVRALGKTRVSTLLGYAAVDDPLDEDQVLRALAASTEVLIVRLELFRVLPVLFEDDASEMGEIPQGETPFAAGRNNRLREEMERLENDITMFLDQLSGADDEDIAPHVSVIENEDRVTIRGPGRGIYCPPGTTDDGADLLRGGA